MVKVYVTEIPKEKVECPFFDVETDKCNITHNECCLKDKPECGHLINLSFDVVDDFELI